MAKPRVEKIIIKSKNLNKEMSVLVYLPCDYHKKKNFPTLYFLHGRSGDENILTDTDLNSVADRLIGNKEIDPMIIICPNLDNSRGLNSSTECKEVKDLMGRTINIGMYEDYLINEVISEIDRRFKTRKNRDSRFIGGASAGGYAALHNAFRHPELFSKAGGHMPAIEPQLEEEDKAYFQSFDNWEEYDPIKIARRIKHTDFKVYLDAGDKDEGKFYDGCSTLNKILTDKGINSENHIFKGHHNIEYIRSNIEKYLKFYGN